MREMEILALGLGYALGAVAFFGMIVLCVRYDQAGKTRRRELEHLEKMKAIELGHAPQDAEVARYTAVGATCIVVPLATFGTALLTTLALLNVNEEVWWRPAVLLTMWGVCGVVNVVLIAILAPRLGQKPTTSTTAVSRGGSGPAQGTSSAGESNQERVPDRSERVQNLPQRFPNS
jgi:hypothetical protein